jgi:hypothetical protein
MPVLQKDEILDRLARRGNVAQFVGFRPNEVLQPAQRFLRTAGHEPNELFFNPHEAIDALLAASGEGKVNVRSYVPDNPRSREFVYGLDTVDSAVAVVRRLTNEGLQASADERTEFSIHPKPRGWRHSHTVIWEHETAILPAGSPAMHWPNLFSRMIGDKAFGLLMADRLGAAVPRTLVIGRRIAPFEFGQTTGSAEVWLRTCPYEPFPGLYTTMKGWTDPFALLQTEDPEGKVLASVLRQDAVRAGHSGAAIVNAHGTLTIEGRRGAGDRLMLGLDRPEPLPRSVTEEVKAVHRRLSAALGPLRMEWVHDDRRAWVVQAQLGATQTTGSILVPGEASNWIEFRVLDGIELLRKRLDGLAPDTGLLLIGEVGVTSHIADLVRRAGAPARLSIRN